MDHHTIPEQSAKQSEKPVFRSEAVFRKKLENYVEFCREQKRIPNPAGFCSHCRIMRREFSALREFYPKFFDIARSVFLDEALNTKAANTGPMMQFLARMDAESAEAEEHSKDGEDRCIRLICDHDGIADGG